MLSNARSVARKEKFILMAAVSVITAQFEEVWYIYIYQTVTACWTTNTQLIEVMASDT